MNKVTFTDEELTRAAKLLQSSMLSSLPTDVYHEFSFEFHRKMAALRRKMKLRSALKTAAKSVAAIFLALLIGGGALLTFDTDTRAAFFSWVREVYENSAFYQFVGDEEAEALPYCRPAWLPEGYVEVDTINNGQTQTIIYRHAENMGDDIIFTYSFADNGTHLHLYSDGFTYHPIQVGKHDADLYIPYDTAETNELLWLDDENGIMYGISSTEETSVILHIAESVYLTEYTKY